MLILKDEKGRRVSFFVVDFHTHVGKEKVLDAVGETFRSNTPRQTVDFYHKLQFELKACMDANPSSYRYRIVGHAEPPPALGWFYEAFGEAWGWTVDQFVAFPFNDYRAYSTTPSFMIPNDMVLRRSLTLPFSPRMLGFVRVDPHDGDAAVMEVERCTSAGARGLKLHPISQNFLDEINSKEVREVVATAVNNGLPVLFDCRYYATAEDIYELVQSLRGEVKRKDFAVVLGHSSMEYTRSGLYDILRDPNIYGDTSGVRGDDVQVFLRKLRDNIEDDWSRKILFGTDFNYFTMPQAVDFLSYLFTWEFYEKLEAKLRDVERILAGNALSIIKPHVKTTSKQGETVKLKGEVGDLFVKAMFHRIGEGAARRKVETLTYDPIVSAGGRVDEKGFISSIRYTGGGEVTLVFRKGGMITLAALLDSQCADEALRVRRKSGLYSELVRRMATWTSLEVDDINDAEVVANKWLQNM
ncbi:MAG: amidohydrolase family protein [Candidatus Jordarchaeales archaeon]